MNTYVLYHKNCFDGFGAAWVAHKHLPTAELIPCNYGEPIPVLPPGSQVMLVDFSFPRDVMIKMNEEASFMKVLDHHKTAKANCEGLDFCEFDMDRSGAGLTWDYFNFPSPRPTLIDVVEDRDLWRFKYPYAKELHAYIASFPKDLETWDRLENDLEHDEHACIAEGRAILRYHDQKATEIAGFESLQSIGGYVVPVVNSPYNFASDVVHLLVTRYPDAPFGASYFFRADGTKQYSLRGRDTDDFDVSTIAKIYGGGGHKKAAGFEIKPDGTPNASRTTPTATSLA